MILAGLLRSKWHSKCQCVFRAGVAFGECLFSSGYIGGQGRFWSAFGKHFDGLFDEVFSREDHSETTRMLFSQPFSGYLVVDRTDFLSSPWSGCWRIPCHYRHPVRLHIYKSGASMEWFRVSTRIVGG